MFKMNKQSKIKIMIASILILLAVIVISLVNAIILTTFSNSLTSENLTFTGNQNITRNLSISRYVNFTSGFMNLSGYSYLLNNSEYYCSGSCRSPENFSDNNYSTYKFLERYGGVGTDTDIYIKNFTIIYAQNYTIHDKFYFIGSDPTGTQTFNRTVFIYNFSSSDWKMLYNNTVITSDSLDQEFDNRTSIIINNNNIQNGIISLKIISSLYRSDGAQYASGFLYDYDLSIEIYPINSSLTIGNSQVWNYTGTFNQTNNKTNDFSLTLNTALNSGACDCSSCSLVGNNCSIPFTFHSDTAGILQYSDIQIDYDPIPYVYLISPENNTWSSSTKTFTCNTTDEINLANITLYIWNSIGIYNNSLIETITGTSNSTNFSSQEINFTASGTYTWNCLVYNNGSYSNWHDSNYTLFVDTTNPSLYYVLPTSSDGYNSTSKNFTIAVNTTDINFANITFNLYNSTQTLFNITTLNPGITNLAYYASSGGSCIQVLTTYTKNISSIVPIGNLINNGQISISGSIDGLIIYNSTSPGGILNTNYTINGIYQVFNASNYATYTELGIQWNRGTPCSNYNINGINYAVYNGIVTINNTYLNFLDGVYYYNVTATDLANNCNSTETRKITLDNTAPTLVLTNPEPQNYGNNNSIPINYTVNDTLTPINIVWYNVLNESGSQIANTTLTGNTTFGLPAGDKNYNFTICANNSLNLINCSTISFGIVTSAPAVALNFPANNVYLNYKNKVYFNYTATSSILERCDLYSDWKTSSWAINYTWIKPNSDVMNFTILNLTDGAYKWSVYCNNTSGNIGVALTNRSLTVDTIYPQINISTPITTVGSQTISFVSNESDINLQSCKFSIYDSLGNVNGLNNNVSFVGGCNTTQNATVTDYATYDLVVYALDKAGNENSSLVSFTTTASSGGNPTGGGGSSSTNVTKIKVFAVVQPFEDRGTYTNLTRAIIYTVLKKYVEEKDYRLAFLTDSRSIAISNILLNNYSVNITSSLMNFWYVNFINKNVDEFLIEESYVNKYGLVGEYLTIIAGDFRIVDPLLNPGTSIVNAFFMRECMGGNNIWRFEVKANKIINECYFKEEGFNCEIDNSSKSIARFSSYINSTNKFIFSNSGEAVLRDKENNTVYQGVVINTYNLCYNFKIVKFKIYAFLLFIVILAIIVVIIIAFKRGYRIKWT